MKRLSIDERWALWMKENPEVLRLFKVYTFEAIASGRKRYGAEIICARIRWHVAIETRGDDFKMNNDFRSRLARWFMETYPQHDGFFEIRKLRERQKLG